MHVPGGVASTAAHGDTEYGVPGYLSGHLIMARLPRIVIPGIPHHITQRGNGRQQTFFEDGDYALYLDLLAQAAERAHVEIWVYCLMPDHVHIILTPGA